jgi:hypothetical protein
MVLGAGPIRWSGAIVFALAAWGCGRTELDIGDGPLDPAPGAGAVGGSVVAIGGSTGLGSAGGAGGAGAAGA